MNYSKVAENLEPSAIRAMMVKSAKIPDVISFGVGEPDFIPEQRVLDAAAKAIPGSAKYTPGAGMTELREVYKDYLNECLHTAYETENVIVTAGGMGALFLGMSAILDAGDEVLIPCPYYANYAPMTERLLGVPVKIPCYEKDGFTVTAGSIEANITPRTKAILLDSPCNPTGSVIDGHTLKEIAEIAEKYDLFILSDEVYRHLTYGTEFHSIASIPGMEKRTLIIDSVSKSFAMTGFRVGFGAGPEEWITLMTKLTEGVYSCIPGFCQHAAIEALKNGKEYRDYMRGEYDKRRIYITGRINKEEKISCIEPKGAFYIYVNISKTGMPATEFSERLLDEKHVVVVPGSNFGPEQDHYVRMSYSTSMEKIVEGMDRIHDFLAEL